MSVPTKVIIIDDDKPSVTVLTNELKAYQASGRGGILYCRCENGKVLLSGACVLYMAGELSGIGGTE